jgi:hypothetical protein
VGQLTILVERKLTDLGMKLEQSMNGFRLSTGRFPYFSAARPIGADGPILQFLADRIEAQARRMVILSRPGDL